MFHIGLLSHVQSVSRAIGPGPRERHPRYGGPTRSFLDRIGQGARSFGT